MAHLDTEAAEAPAPESVEDKAAAFEEYIFDETDEEQETDSEETEAEEVEDLELDEEGDEETDEQEAPAIDPPVSLNAEEKEVFAQLPPEAQQAWAASETRRNTDVQKATTTAAEAQRAAEQKAAAAEAEAKAVFAAQLEEIGKAVGPTEPQKEWYPDQLSYLTACREYDRQLAQHKDFMQQVAELKTEATTEADTAFIEQRDRELMAIPEVANPETRKEYLDNAMAMAGELGYDQAELAKNITAAEIQRLSEIRGWKEKADKYDTAMSRRMKKVRAAKGKSLRPNAAPQGKSRAAKANKAWENVKSAGKNKAAQTDALVDYFEATGHL